MPSTSSKVALAIGITLSVAAISAIFITMVSMQNLTSSGVAGSQSANQQQQSSQPQTTTSSSGGGGGNNTGTTSTIIIPVGAVNQNVQHYEPNPATVAPNSRVTWDNQDSAPHTATATDGSFDTGIIQAGASGLATMPAQGTISYQCTIHPWMTATLQVSSSSSAPSTGGPSSLPSEQQQNGTGAQQQPQRQQQVGNQTAQNGTTTTVDAGGGGPKSVLTWFTPQQVTINAGETVVWKNPTVVGEPHTVTFIKGQGYFAAEESPYLIANGTKLTPANPEENNTAPRIIPSQNDTANNIIYVENARLTDPVIIDAQNNVEYLPLNANYTMTGDELYVNSGLIWPEGQAAPGDPPIKSFSVTFEKAGTYDYVCLIHPWMGGEVAVK